MDRGDGKSGRPCRLLSIEATVAGKRFLVDTGVPTYTAGDLRDAARSAAAHNGPRLLGEEPLEFWKSFRVGRRGYAGLLDTSRLADLAPFQTAGWQSGYAYLKTDVRRFIGMWPGRALLVADLWLGSAENAQLDFLFQATGPQIKVANSMKPTYRFGRCWINL